MAEDARSRRLKVDHDKMLALAARSGGALTIDSAGGTPPSRYIVRLRCKGVEKADGERPVVREEHRIEIKVPAAYPLAAPYVRLLTPVFHPHIFENGQVCLGSRWVVGEGLDNLIIRLASILRGDPDYFDFASAANLEAADWFEQHPETFPLQADPFGSTVTARSGGPGRSVRWEDQPEKGV